MTTNDYAFDQSRTKVFFVVCFFGEICEVAFAIYGQSGARWMCDKPWKKHWKRAQFKCLRCEPGLASGLDWPALVAFASAIRCCCCCCCSMQALMGRVSGCHCRILMYLEIRCWCRSSGLRRSQCTLYSGTHTMCITLRELVPAWTAHCSRWFLRRLHLNVPRQQHSIWNIYTEAFSLRFALI